MGHLSYAETAGRIGAPPSAIREATMTAKSKHTTDGYLLANGIDRHEADRLRAEYPGAIVSRNIDGTYRVTRGR